ncbi:MAG: DUF2341 domain-containing protein [Myxococcota bacterium]
MALPCACTLDKQGQGEERITCGNGWLDEGEACDGELLPDVACNDYGFTHGDVACDDRCQLDTSACHTCGNGVREGGEDCDGADLGGASCKSATGFESGSLGCTSQCRFDRTGCRTCGNGTIEQGEACDGYVDIAHSCETEADLPDGILLCSASCEIDVSRCHHCGNGSIEGPEQCDVGDLGGWDCAQLGFSAGTLLCSDSCQLDPTQCFVAPGDWYDPNWKVRRRIVVHDAMVEAPLADFPLLVSLAAPDIVQHATSSAAFVFTGADGVTVLPHEVEAFDPATGALLAWVKVPHLIPSIENELYVYYGNSSPPVPPGAGAVWSNEFVGVWHLGEEAIDESDGALHDDAVTGQHTGTQHGNHDVAGKIGRAQSFDGMDYIDFAQPGDIELGNMDCTVSAWVRTTSWASMSLVKKSAEAMHASGDKLLGLIGGRFAMDHGWVGFIDTSTTVNDGQWHHLVWTQRRNANGQAEAWTLYVDGVQGETAEHTTLADVVGHVLRLGEGTSGSSFPGAWDGEVDELRISRTARSAAWVSTSYLNQHVPQSFLTIGPAQGVQGP